MSTCYITYGNRSFFRTVIYISLIGLTFGCSSTGKVGRGGDRLGSSVEYSRNVQRVRIVKIGTEDNSVEIIIRQTGTILEASSPQNLLIQGDSGTQRVNEFIGYQNIVFPFRGRVNFDYSKGNRSDYNAVVSYVLSDSGKWLVVISY